MKAKAIAGTVLAAGLFGAIGSQTWAAKLPTAGPVDPVQEGVRKALVTIPFLTVFDDLAFRVDGGSVTLLGEVTRPVIKDYAEKAVRQAEGVTAVDDQIEVLPLSPFDDSIRLRMFRALSRNSSLSKYFLGTNPSIRIVVKNGHVMLDGVVLNSMDRQMAFMTANQVPGVFEVVNNLRTEQEAQR